MKIKVIGLGNPLASDDAVGLHVVRRLEKMKLPSNVELVIAESTGPSILELIAGAEKAVLIDAVVGGSKPGTIHRLSLDDIQTGRSRVRSLHELGLVDLLKMGQLAQPEVFPKKLVILGIEVADTGRYKQGLSSVLRNVLQRTAEAVLEELRSEFVLDK